MQPVQTPHRALVYIDMPELLNVLPRNGEHPLHQIRGLLNRLSTFLQRKYNTEIVQGFAYGTPEDAQYHLLPGMELRLLERPELVSRTMELDILEHALLRPNIERYVLITGQGQHGPLFQRLEQWGKMPVLLAEDPERASEGVSLKMTLLLPVQDVLSMHQPVGSASAGTFKPIAPLPYPLHRDVLYIIEQGFGKYEEIYLTPLLRKLSDELGDLEEHTPKSLINDLIEVGAVRLEKRSGIPHDYTVLIVNDEHPEVQEVREELAQGAGPPYHESDSDSYSPY